MKLNFKVKYQNNFYTILREILKVHGNGIYDVLISKNYEDVNLKEYDICIISSELFKIVSAQTWENLKNTDFGIRLDDLKDSSDGEVHQMKYEFETLIMGSKFFHQFVLEDCNDVEKSCFSHMFKLWCERPYIGGKSSVGYGKLSLDYPSINYSFNHWR